LVKPDEFSWVSGENLLTHYGSNADSGLMFCSKCGSTLCGTYDGKIHGISLGCVDGDPGIQIERHIFVGSKAAWEIIPENVLQYDEWPN